MRTAQTDFRLRLKETSSYLLWLARQERDGGLPEGIINTSKSSVLLLLYNLVESTVTNALQDLYDELYNLSVSFDDMSKCMRVFSLNNLKGHKASKIEEKLSRLVADIYYHSFRKDDVFSGNIDAKVIRDLMGDLGMSKRFNYEEPELLTIKTKRNDLAHGALSFTEVGKDLSAKDLIKKYWRIRVFLGHMLSDFDSFIASNQYLKTA